MWRQNMLYAIRCAAAVIVVGLGPSLIAPPQLSADEDEGGCKAHSSSGCITQSGGAYEGKYCAAGACMTCSEEIGSVCAYCADLVDYYNGSSKSCDT